MVVLLLDFEKAYDRVDWDFLQGTMLRFGFEDSWIKGVAALYSTATSRIPSRAKRTGDPLDKIG